MEPAPKWMYLSEAKRNVDKESFGQTCMHLLSWFLPFTFTKWVFRCLSIYKYFYPFGPSFGVVVK